MHIALRLAWTAIQVAVFWLVGLSLTMLDKEAFCRIAQAIYDDLLLLLVGQGALRRHLIQPAGSTHKIFFICRFPSASNTSHYHEDLKVISEDEMGILQSALAGTQSVSVVLFQVQTHFQKKVLQLYQDADKLAYVCLFHECFVNATCVDLVTAVCSSLRRHLSRVHCVSKYQEFVYSPDGNQKKVTKSTYFVIFHSSFTTGGIEVIRPVLSTLRRGYATVQCSPHKFMKKSNQFLKFFAFVCIRMLSQSRLHSGSLIEAASHSVFHQLRLNTALAVWSIYTNLSETELANLTNENCKESCLSYG